VTKPKKQKIKMPDGTIQTWPQKLAYALWLAIPGATWIKK
jgi:hypothetical protein